MRYEPLYNSIRNKLFVFAVFLLIEIISFLGYLVPSVNAAGFFAGLLAVLALSIKDLRWGLLAIAAELVIGSKGYLFSLVVADFTLSLRIGLWLVVMGVWAVKLALGLYKDRGAAILPYKSKLLYGYMAIWFVFVWGVANGLARGNALSAVFFDANAWLFLFLILPLLSVRDRLDKKFVQLSGTVLAAALVWLCAKTLLLLYLFSHGFPDLVWPLYRWVRESGVGEITRFDSGFYRIFFQSHIYLLPALLVFLERLAMTPYSGQKRDFWRYFSLVSLVLAANIVSLSRSNWVGLAFGLAAYFIWRIARRDVAPSASLKTGLLRLYPSAAFRSLALLGATALASLALITTIIAFPWPGGHGGTSAFSMIRERVGDTDEAALNSRWDLLDALWPAVKEDWLLGRGFGSAVSYRSSDPRALEAAGGGLYTTYAFEWGWLDMWLKLGVLGSLAYLGLIGHVVWGLFGFVRDCPKGVSDAVSPPASAAESPAGDSAGAKRVCQTLNAPLAIGLLAIAAVHAFSPYLNHPLGIGYVLICSVLLFMQNDQVSSINDH